MFLTTDECYEELYKWLEQNPTLVQISSFGIYAGIVDSGKDIHKIGGKYTSSTHTFLDKLAETNVKTQILIGVAAYTSCKEDKSQCKDCFKKYSKNMMRLLKHVENWPNFEWRFREELHLKCTIFNYKDAKKDRILGGGRNLTDSNWADISFEPPRELVPDLKEYFINQWNVSTPVTEEKLAEYVTESFAKSFAI